MFVINCSTWWAGPGTYSRTEIIAAGRTPLVRWCNLTVLIDRARHIALVFLNGSTCIRSNGNRSNSRTLSMDVGENVDHVKPHGSHVGTSLSKARSLLAAGPFSTLLKRTIATTTKLSQSFFKQQPKANHQAISYRSILSYLRSILTSNHPPRHFPSSSCFSFAFTTSVTPAR